MRLRRGCKGVGDIALTLGDGAMRTGCGVGAAVDTLEYVTSGFTVRDGGVVEIRRGVGRASACDGDGGISSTEGERVDTVSVGVAIDVVKISEMLWITCNYSLSRVKKGVAGEGVVSTAVREQALLITWSLEKACVTGHWWRKKWTVLAIILEHGFVDVYAVATIVFAGKSDVPAVNGVRGPSETLGWGLKDQDLGA